MSNNVEHGFGPHTHEMLRRWDDIAKGNKERQLQKELEYCLNRLSHLKLTGCTKMQLLNERAKAQSIVWDIYEAAIRDIESQEHGEDQTKRR